MQTSFGDISSEIWSSIKYYSEVEANGILLAERNGVRGRSARLKAWNDFRAYIRQAESYYNIARKTHTRSASLLYYYCFLNIVKAGLRIKGNTGVRNKVGHGLYFNSNPKVAFSKLTLKFNSGIGTQFYKSYYSVPPSRRPLKLVKLLGYCSDVGTQYEMANYGPDKLHPMYSAVLHNSNTQRSWGIMGIYDFDSLKPYVRTFKKLLDDYEPLSGISSNSKELFGLDAWHASSFTFLQERTTHKWIDPNTSYPHDILSGKMATALTNTIHPNYFSMTPYLYVAEPYTTNNQMAFDEPFAIYTLMFSLSNLVRYNPAFLEKLLNSTDAWMIENFIQFTPETFLRSIIGWLIGTDYVYMRR